MSSLQRDPQNFQNSNWTDEDRALHDGAPGYCYVATLNETCEFYSFSLGEIPSSSVSVEGLAVIVDVYKDETGGSGTLQVGAELSWNGGTNYTTSGKKTGNLTTTETRTTLGGAADAWGRSWTRSELDSLRIRVKAEGSSIVDSPQWRLDYVAIALYWSSTATLALDMTERLDLRDSHGLADLSLDVDEPLALLDGGQAPGSEWKEFEIT